MEKDLIFYTYVVECSDGSYYTGSTDNLKLRLQEHNTDYPKKGAIYTRSKRPVKLQHFETFQSRGEAMKRENEIKKLTHEEKRVLCNNGNKVGYI